MNTKIFLVSLAVLASVITLVLAATFMTQVEFQDVADTGASVNANVRSSVGSSGLSNVRINMRVKDLESTPGKVFETWLVDDDTGYKLSIGAFTTNRNGRANFRFSQSLVNYGIYDKIVITSEDLMDEDPSPGQTLLVANLPETSIVSLVAELNGANEVPSTDSNATGTGLFVLNTEDNTLSYEISYEGLEGIEISSHIHGFAMSNETAAALHELTTDNPKVGVWNYDESQEDNIIAGLTYVNIHSTEFPDGELRGQIVLA